MYRKFFSAFIFLLVFSSIYSQNKEEKKQILDHLKVQNKKMASFFENSMADSIAGMFSPNCHFAVEYEPIRESSEEVSSYFSDQFESGMKISAFKLKPLEKKIYDDIVLEIGTNTIEYTLLAQKEPIVIDYNYMFVWKRSKKDKYRIRAAMWNLPEE